MNKLTIIFLITLVTCISSCKKDETKTQSSVTPPALVFYDATNQTDTTCEFYGSVEIEGTHPVLLKGFCWGEDTLPTLANFYSENGSGPSIFDTTAYQLTPNTWYFVRAFATTQAGTYYQGTKKFKTFQ